MNEPQHLGRAALILCVTLLFICFCGDPDLIDAIVSFLMRGTK